MNPELGWTIKYDDGQQNVFIDLRRKVGNSVIRAYLLQPLLTSDRVRTVSGRLRGPRNEFKDFSKFLIVRIRHDNKTVNFLVETEVYENMRIVATDDVSISELPPKDIIGLFTESLTSPDVHELLVFKSGNGLKTHNSV